ncbi:hypothetical protein PENSPDRAFT_733149 [Peniophora sp. CONT]|nr:hypothetical protein PENSPDRAFT_733149 [Peniophora sp. CONT]
MTQFAQSDATASHYLEWLSSDDLAGLEQTVSGFKNTSEADFARYFRYYHVERMRVLGELRTAILETVSSAKHDSRAGAAFRARFGQLRTLDDLERSVIEPRPDVDLTGEYADKAYRYSTIATAFRTRFENFAEPKDLECAVTAARIAVTHTPEGDETQATVLNNLCIALQMRFGRRGELDDLEEAIISSRKAVEVGASTDGGASRAAHYNNLSLAYEARYNRLGALDDNDKAITAIRRALELIPVEDSRYAALLNSLGNGLLARYERLSHLPDLEEAVDAAQKAVHMVHPPTDAAEGQLVDLSVNANDISRPGYRSNLCNALTLRYKRLGRVSDLENAIAAARLALPDMDLVHQPLCLCGLGIALTLKSQHPGADDSVAALDEALAVLNRAIQLTPDGDTDWVEWSIYLGDAYAARHASQSHQNDLTNAVGCYSKAAGKLTGQPAKRFKAAIAWARLCSTNDMDTALIAAYECIVSLAPLLMWLGQSAEHRYEQVTHGLGDVISEAAAAAISVGRMDLAVQWLEAGRGIVWSQLSNLRSPVDSIRAVNATLADDFERVAVALQSSNGHKADRHSLDPARTMPEVNASGIEQAAKNRRDLARQYEGLLEEIRAIDGFRDFLRPPRLSSLRAAAVDGPVVMVNVHSSRCDALILTPAGNLRHVALPCFSQKLAQTMYSSFLNELGHTGLRDPLTRATAASITKQGATSFVPRILERLWVQVAEPILTAMADMLPPTTDGTLPHVTWCATGHLAHLPLHAAGLWHAPTAQQARVIDRVVSSYTPSLSALLRCQRISTTSASPDDAPHLLVVTQANAPGWAPLPGTLEEAKILIRRFAGYAFVLGEEHATVSAVTDAMKGSAWVHLACHGVQKTTNPTESGFVLYDGSLTLGALMEESTDRAELAFLSACQTATGDASLSEEAVHLAAGMLAVGFRAVVGTLWSIGDAEAPIVADAFYASLLEQRRKFPTFSARTGAAYALHDAVACQSLESEGRRGQVPEVGAFCSFRRLSLYSGT